MPPTPLLGRERLWPTVVVSLAVHAALIALVLCEAPAAAVDLNQKPIVARLVRLGEEAGRGAPPAQGGARRRPRPPRPPPPAPPPPAPAPPAPTRRAGAMAPPKAEPAKPAPRVASTRRAATGGGLASALSRGSSKQETEYGSPDGDPRGDADQGEAGDQYLALVTRALQDTTSCPPRSPTASGSTSARPCSSSSSPTAGSRAGSSSTAAGTASSTPRSSRRVRSARLPPPPPEWRERYRAQGLGRADRPTS